MKIEIIKVFRKLFKRNVITHKYKSNVSQSKVKYTEKQLNAAYEEFFSTRSGRIILHDLMKQCGFKNTMQPSMNNLDQVSIYIQGQRDVVVYIMNRADETIHETINTSKSKKER